jgi:hypothetical protein
VAGPSRSNTVADLLGALDLALPQLPAPLRDNVLVRSDAAGSSREFPAGIAARAGCISTAGSPSPVTSLKRSPRSPRRPGPRSAAQNAKARTSPT